MTKLQFIMSKQAEIDKEALLPLIPAIALAGKVGLAALSAYGVYSGGKTAIEGIKERSLGKTIGGGLEAGLSILPYGSGKLLSAVGSRAAAPIVGGVSKVFGAGGRAARAVDYGVKGAVNLSPYVAGGIAGDMLAGGPGNDAYSAGAGQMGAMAGIGGSPQYMGATGVEAVGSPTAGANMAQAYNPTMQFGQQSQGTQNGFPWQKT
jgi:hypothetical protein